MNRPYNIFEKYSIITFAKYLRSQTLRNICGSKILEHGYSGKGTFGQILEKFYFEYEPNSESEPDFKEAGLELKSSPLKLLKNKEYRSKERLVLNIINYFDVVNQDFETSSFWKKNANLLLVFYLHNATQNILDYVIKIVDEWNFPNTDLEIIKRDWAFIKKKITDGKAHELSEGDTFYLGACTKGAKGGNPREQPFNKIYAKQRAYSLKQGYVNHIIASISHETTEVYGKLIKSIDIVKEKTIEEIVISKFELLYNKSIEEILRIIKVVLNQKAKNFYANLTNAILGIELDRKIEEFEKADIIVKTVRLKENNLPKEDISFPAFKYKEIVEEEWEESQFKQILEHKFLFVFFQFSKNTLILRKVKFWNMPYNDLQEVKKVWEETVKRIKQGKAKNLPKKSENKVSHIRPHAKNGKDTYETPQGEQVIKKCFWLNNSYIRDEIYLK